jgi:predicted GTPase
MDSKKREEALVDFYELGADTLYPVSAAHASA